MQYPSSIFFVNAELTDEIKLILTTQLMIHETLTGSVFDGYVSTVANYIKTIHNTGTRLLVIRDSLLDYTNRTLADVVLNVNQGLAYVEFNNYGPPSLSLPIYRLNIFDLLRYNNKI